jgi:CRISPR type IV-associated DEAD/DEAH-box helicase Csf4
MPDRLATDDETITDLVVTRLPFGLSQSLGQRVKLALQSRAGYLEEALDCARRLRQGLGRPVRRDGLNKNRRFFVLDGRLSDPASLAMTAPALRVIESYRPRIHPLSAIKDMRQRPAK